MTTTLQANNKIMSFETEVNLTKEERDNWSFLDILPPEVTVLIFSYVHLIDLGHIAITCKSLNLFLDTNENWKQIYELKFDTITADRVNLTQDINWKQLVIEASYLLKWRKEFSHTTIPHKFTFSHFASGIRSSYITSDGQRQVFVARNFIYAVVDLKMAGKFVPVKINPMSLYSGLTYGSGDGPSWFKSQLIKHHSFIAPKNGVYVVPETKLAAGCIRFSYPAGSNGHGDFFINVDNNQRSLHVLWQVDVHGKARNSSTPPILSFKAPETSRSSVWKFNKNYVVHLDPDTGEVLIIDLSKRCLHCNPMSNTGANYEREMKNCDKGCAIVHQSTARIEFIFASQLNPDIVIGLAPIGNTSDFELIVWNKGQIQVPVPFQGLHGLTRQRLNLTEHVTERDGIKRHWFGNYCEDQSVFVDLNNLSVKPVIYPGCTSLAWVPNENKMALGSAGQVTVFDLDKRAWCSVMFCRRFVIYDLTFSKGGQILFVTLSRYIEVCYWKTGWIIATLSHQFEEPRTTHFVLDQLLVVSSCRESIYYKLRSKLDI